MAQNINLEIRKVDRQSGQRTVLWLDDFQKDFALYVLVAYRMKKRHEVGEMSLSPKM